MATFAARGCFTALVTPFSADGSTIDWDAYEKLVEAQIAGGVKGLVPCGTTGESATLTEAEELEIIRRTVRIARGRAYVVPGTGSNSTKTAIEATRAAFEAGADGAMIVMPYYNKPSQDGLRNHVELIAKAAAGPLMLYNIPGRTAVDLQVDTLGRILDACPNVVALKDASNGVQYCQAAARFGDRLSILSGDDGLTVPMMSVGALGVVSVTSNLYPREVSTVVDHMLTRRVDVAREAHLKLLPVHNAMFIEPSPAPVKAALAARGRMNDSVRPPILPATPAARERIQQTIDAFEGR
jgi:4-hydroxy-tetrahydrodipicolinate synthase